MTQQICKKLKGYFHKNNFIVIIRDSFSHDKLCSFINKIGIEFPGVRISSISNEELAIALTEESWIHPEIMEELVKCLNNINQDEINKIKNSTLWDVKGYLKDTWSHYSNKDVGKILWALVCDERRDVNSLIRDFMEDVLKLHDKYERMEEKQFKELKDQKKFEKVIVKEFGNYVSQLEEDSRNNDKLIEKLKGENERLHNEINRMQERIRELQKGNAQIADEKGILKRENEKIKRIVENLTKEVLQLKDKLRASPKIKLVSQLHYLEKENRKLSYELEKERGAGKEELQKYILENKELHERLNELQIMTYRLEEELGMERKRLEDLKKEMELQVPNPLSETPLHKGKRLGIFVDGQNVYYSARLHYGKRLDYKKLLLTLTRDRHLVKAVCYIVEQPSVDQENFINMLRYSGYAIRSRNLIRRADGSLKANWDVGMATDIINLIEKNNLDIVVLVTCDGDFTDLLKLLKPKGIRVEVAGFPYNTAMELKEIADEFYQIEEELMLTTV